ncbi:MAG: toll/interleukin-1 receptor domain-containing protein [Lachnospiraceae bacterium]|nr:toll/interleukin-1 receptor domain-containing protein [Lachnospiraceae bacterium]
MYHLKNYGIPIWYDYHQLILGDNRDYKNLVEGIQHNSYAIIILSKNIFDCVCANDELLVIKQQYALNKIHVFPIFYQIKASELPEKYRWLCKLIYNEVDEKTGTLLTCNQIALKYIQDKNRQYLTRNLVDYKKGVLLDDSYIHNMLTVYFEIDYDCLNLRILTLFAIFKYLCCKYANIEYPPYCIRTFNKLYNIVKLNLKIDWKEISILENILLLMLNIISQGLAEY